MTRPFRLYAIGLILAMLCGNVGGFLACYATRPAVATPTPASPATPRPKSLAVTKAPAPVVPASVPDLAAPAFPRGGDESPFRRAARISGHPEAEIRAMCLEVQEYSQIRPEVGVDAATLATMLAETTEQVRRRTGKPYVIDPTLFLAAAQARIITHKSVWTMADELVNTMSAPR